MTNAPDPSTHDAENYIDCSPSPAQLGDTTTIQPSEWTPLDDIGTQIYIYGDQPVDIAVQYAEVDDEIRHLRESVGALARGLLEIAEVAMPDSYLATDSRVQRARHALASGLLPADEHHFDVSCDGRPDCMIPQHHALEDMR